MVDTFCSQLPLFRHLLSRFRQQKSLICLPDKLGFFELSVPQAEREASFGREVRLRLVKCASRDKMRNI